MDYARRQALLLAEIKREYQYTAGYTGKPLADGQDLAHSCSGKSFEPLAGLTGDFLADQGQ